MSMHLDLNNDIFVGGSMYAREDRHHRDAKIRCSAVKAKVLGISACNDSDQRFPPRLNYGYGQRVSADRKMLSYRIISWLVNKHLPGNLGSNCVYKRWYDPIR